MKTADEIANLTKNHFEIIDQTEESVIPLCLILVAASNDDDLITNCGLVFASGLAEAPDLKSDIINQIKSLLHELETQH